MTRSSDSFIGVAPDGPGPAATPPGKNMDMSQVATGSGNVQRERVTVGDPEQGDQLAGVNRRGAMLVYDDMLYQLVALNTQMLQELRALRLMWGAITNQYVELEDLGTPLQ